MEGCSGFLKEVLIWFPRSFVGIFWISLGCFSNFIIMNKIIFGITSDLFFAVANMVINLKKQGCKGFDEVVVFVADKARINPNELAGLVGLSTSDLKVSVLDGAEVVPEVKDRPDELDRFLKRYSSMTLLKALVPILFKKDKFKDCQNILWMDCDMLPLLSIDSILEFSGDNVVAACLGGPANRSLKEPELLSKLAPTDIKPNGGLVLWNRETSRNIEDPQKFVEEIYGYAIKLANCNNAMIDEFSVLFAIKSLRANFCLLPQIYNQLPENYNPATVIVHSVGGRRKFWDNEIVNLMYSQWENANHDWLMQLMRVGVPYEELPKYNKSKFKVGSRKKHIDAVLWRTFWLTKCSEIKFQHPSVYFYPDVSTNTITFISQIRKGLRFLLSKEKNEFVFSAHVSKPVTPTLSALGVKYEIVEYEQFCRIHFSCSSQEGGELLTKKNVVIY